MTRSIQILSLILLLLIAPALCGSMLWVCVSEAKAQTTIFTPLRPIKIDIWDPNNEAAIIAAFRAEGYEVKQTELDPDHFIDSIVAVPRYLYWNGRALQSFKVKLGECGCVEFDRIVWFSSFRIFPSLRSAVREFLRAEGVR